MAESLIAAMPPDLDLPDGYTVEWVAIDATGANVSGVIVKDVSIFGTVLGLGSDGGGGAIGPFLLVPGPSA